MSTSRRCRFCLRSSWTDSSPSMAPCTRKWDITRLIDRSETSRHIAIWSLLRNFDSRRIAHCISDEILVRRGMTTEQLVSAAQKITGDIYIYRTLLFRKSWSLLSAARSLMMTSGRFFRVVWYSFRGEMWLRCRVMAGWLLRVTCDFFFPRILSRGQLAWKRQ